MTRALLTAGIGNTDRPERWDFVCHLWERLAHTLEALGVQTKVLVHPTKMIRPQTFFSMRSTLETAERVMDEWTPTHLFLWNGNSDGDEQLLAMAKIRGIIPVYAELGWFPQQGHLHFDPKGVNASSSFSKPFYPPLHPLERQELERFRSDFREGKPQSSERHHLVALQDESDSNITNSIYDSMHDFVEDVLRSLEGDDTPVLVRKHPHQQSVDLRGLNGFELDDGGIYSSIMAAKTVHAINSTVLLEAAMLGKRIKPWGRGVIHPECGPSIDALLYHLLDRQLRWGDLADEEKMRHYPVFATVGLYDH